MAKKQNFEILSDMASQKKDIRMSTTLVSATKNGQNGHITMGVEGNSVVQMVTDPDRYVPILFLVDRKQYFELAEQESEWDQIKAKAAAMDVKAITDEPDTPISVDALVAIGFRKRERSKNYYYRDITAAPHDVYFFFKYCGKDLPICSNMESLKSLIAGIYGEIL